MTYRAARATNFQLKSEKANKKKRKKYLQPSGLKDNMEATANGAEWEHHNHISQGGGLDLQKKGEVGTGNSIKMWSGNMERKEIIKKKKAEGGERIPRGLKTQQLSVGGGRKAW